MFSALTHLFFPRVGNNHRAHILHPYSVFIFLGVFSILQILVSFAPGFIPRALGTTVITPEKVIEITNKKRTELGLSKLKMDATLSIVAQSKAADMIARNYWAHNAPDGTEPWHFFKEAGYSYHYAGENLARDFTNPEDVVSAWIASPTHKENLFSPKYQEIGVAVVEGELKGRNTVLVVQHFGTKLGITLGPEAQKVQPVQTAQGLVEGKTFTGFSQVAGWFSITRTLGIFILGLFALIFVVDMVVIRAESINRAASRSSAHIIFLVAIILGALALKSGMII
ncbi:MAG: CAP domain-containing protein [Patescibacteria group bacterium]